MKSMRSIFCLLLAAALCLSAAIGCAATLTLPANLRAIEAEAFCGDTSLDEVVLPEGLEKIGSRAFAGSSVSRISLPASLTSIADNAFSGCGNVEISALAGSRAYYWAIEHGYIPDAQYTPADAFVYTIENSQCYITGYNGNEKNVAIPVYIEDCPVTQIGSSAFRGNTSIASVFIPDYVTTIGNSAFEKCTGLKEIDLPDALTKIDSHAFRGCIGLTHVQLPDSVNNIGTEAFKNCSLLAEINYPLNWTVAGDSGNIFTGTQVRFMDIPEGVAVIPADAFQECTNFTAINIPSTVTAIGNDAFYGCTGLTELELPETLASIGSRAFKGCIGLTSIWLPDNVNSIGTDAFMNCSSLVEINYPLNWTSAGDSGNIFAGTQVRSLDIPEGVTVIPADAFQGCTNFAAINIPSTVTTIDTDAFYGCSGLTEIKLPEALVKIGTNAFRACTALKSIRIPDNVSSIGTSAFNGCSSLAEANYPLNWMTAGATIFKGTQVRTLDIPEGVTVIPANAFQDCTNFTAINIPSTVTTIEIDAFYGCSGLTEIKLPEALVKIGSEAFRACTALKSIRIPDNVSSIGTSAFNGCSSLAEANYPLNWTTAGESIFKGTQVRTLNIPEGVAVIPANAFQNCTNFTAINIPSTVTTINNDAFYGCSGLTEINLPEALLKIGTNAFRACTALKIIRIPDNVSSIGISAFNGCSSLAEANYPLNWTTAGENIFKGTQVRTLNIPEGVTVIPANAFQGCTNFTEIIIPSTVTTIGNDAFYGCIGLRGIKLPGALLKIGANAFRECTGFTSIVIPGGVSSIGQYAFYQCISLVSVSIPESVTSIGSNAFAKCSNLTIYGVAGSAAENYAVANSIPFVAGEMTQVFATVSDYALNGVTAEITVPVGSTLTFGGMVHAGDDAQLVAVQASVFDASDHTKGVKVARAENINAETFDLSSFADIVVGKTYSDDNQTLTMEAGKSYDVMLYATNTYGCGFASIPTIRVNVVEASDIQPSAKDYQLSADEITEGDTFTISGTILGNGSNVTRVTVSAFLHDDHNVGVHLQSLEGNAETFNLEQFKPFRTDCVYIDNEDRMMSLNGGNTYDIVIYAALENGGYFLNDTNPMQTITIKKEVVDTPNVLSVKFASDSVAVNEEIGVIVETDMDAEQLYMYAEDRSWGRCGSWAVFDSDTTIDGDKRIWNIDYTFNLIGDRTLTFYAAKDGKNEGAGCDASIEVYEPEYTGISVENYTLSKQFVKTDDIIELNGIVRGHGSNLSEVSIMLAENDNWNNAVCVATYEPDGEEFNLSEETAPIIVGEAYGGASTYGATSRSSATDWLTMVSGNNYQVILQVLLENGEVLNDGYGMSRFVKVQDGEDEEEPVLEKVEFAYVPEKITLYDARAGFDVIWDDSLMGFYKLEYKLDTEEEYHSLIKNYGCTTLYYSNLGSAKELQLRLSMVNGDESGEVTTEVIPIQTLGDLSFVNLEVGKTSYFDVSQSDYLKIPFVCENAARFEYKGIFINDYPSGNDQSANAVDEFTGEISMGTVWDRAVVIKSKDMMQKLGPYFSTDAVKAPYLKIAVTPYDEEGNQGTTRWVGFRLVNGDVRAAGVSFNDNLPDKIESSKPVTISWTPTSNNVLYYNLYYRHSSWPKGEERLEQVPAPNTSAEICISESQGGHVFLSLYAVLMNDNHSHVDATIEFKETDTSEGRLLWEEQLKELLENKVITKNEYDNRVKVLAEADKYCNYVWTSPVSFHTWKGGNGKYNSNNNMVRGGKTSDKYQFVKEVTYIGLPYCAHNPNNNYTISQWEDLISNQSNLSDYEGTATFNGSDRSFCTIRGIDCSGLIHNSLKKMDNYDLTWLTTSRMRDHEYFKVTSTPIPGDFLLGKTGVQHVRMYAGKKEDGTVMVYESVADGARGISGCVYRQNYESSSYNYYTYKNYDK